MSARMDRESSSKLLDMHHHNCFLLLKTLNIVHLKELTRLNPFLETINLSGFDEAVPYSRIYKELMDNLAKDIAQNPSSPARDLLIKALYENDSHVLENTFEHIEDVLEERDYGQDLEVAVQAKVAKGKGKGHVTSPSYAGSSKGRIESNISRDFSPMHTTSLPSAFLRYPYQAKADKPHIQLRFGTQVVRKDKKSFISPIFAEYTRIKDSEAKCEVAHVYFNLLPYDPTKHKKVISQDGAALDDEGYLEQQKSALLLSERQFTECLHQFESRSRTLIIITLPAKGKYMGAQDYADCGPTETSAGILLEHFRGIARGGEEFDDFYVSQKAKVLLYGEARAEKRETYDCAQEEKIIKDLLDISLEAVMGQGFEKEGTLSVAEQQAVWFHFTKFAYPDFVLGKLNPETWNTACKDAIDRGGVAAAYYNLMKSFEVGPPLTKKEFEMALYSAAAMVKGRGVNHHINLIWNTIDCYVNANITALVDDPSKTWLIHWRNDNTPRERLKEVKSPRIMIEHNSKIIESFKHVEGYDSAKCILESAKAYLIEGDELEAVTLKRNVLLIISLSTQLVSVQDKGLKEKLLERLQTAQEDLGTKRKGGTTKKVGALALNAVCLGLSRRASHKAEQHTKAASPEKVKNLKAILAASQALCETVEASLKASPDLSAEVRPE
jgi:hypothetical protein